MAYEAKIIADSICAGHRLTTMQLTHPRIVHAEFMTHCMFARNASSSRAIPFEKMKQKVLDDPFIPIWWGKNQPGMQANEEIEQKKEAWFNWILARNEALLAAQSLHDLGLHKQICNRLLEPFGWITVCVTGDSGAWSNYFALRCHPDAMPEIRKQAEMARDLYFSHEPEEFLKGDWHLPYVSLSDLDVTADWLTKYMKVSVGRCARTSYLTQEGVRDPEKDIELHDKLINAVPKHASPFEHVAQAMGNDTRYAKYVGWRSYRHLIPGEYITNWRPQ